MHKKHVENFHVHFMCLLVMGEGEGGGYLLDQRHVCFIMHFTEGSIFFHSYFWCSIWCLIFILRLSLDVQSPFFRSSSFEGNINNVNANI